jgi:HlyD family secretion protein
MVQKMLKLKTALIWCAGVLSLIGMSYFYHGESSLFYGVAEASERIISSESAVEVLAIPVLSGQKVHVGDTLIRLRRTDLEIRMSELGRELEGVAGKTTVSSSELDTRVAEIRGNLERQRNQIQFEINRLLEERKRNRDLTLRLQSLPQSIQILDTNDSYLLKARSLERELASAETAANHQIGLLRGSQGAQRSTGQMERSALMKELAMLRAEQTKLTIIASQDAIVGSVNCHAGEKMSPFTSLLTLSAHSPTLVRGYIHEKVYNRIALGDQVDVVSAAERGGTVRGTVVGVGSRIVEFPIRLRKIPEMLVWGREVMIQIPSQNDFLLGEMVSVNPVFQIPLRLGAMQ